MTSYEITVSRQVPVPAMAAWAVITDIAHWPLFITAVEDVEMVTKGPVGLGTTWHEFRMVQGERTSRQMEIAQFVPPTVSVSTDPGAAVQTQTALFAVKTTVGSDEFLSEYSVIPPAAGVTTTNAVTLQVRFTGHRHHATTADRMAWKMLGAVGLRIAKTGLQRDLADMSTEAVRRVREERRAGIETPVPRQEVAGHDSANPTAFRMDF